MPTAVGPRPDLPVSTGDVPQAKPNLEDYLKRVCLGTRSALRAHHASFAKWTTSQSRQAEACSESVTLHESRLSRRRSCRGQRKCIVRDRKKPSMQVAAPNASGSCGRGDAPLPRWIARDFPGATSARTGTAPYRNRAPSAASRPTYMPESNGLWKAQPQCPQVPAGRFKTDPVPGGHPHGLFT
jgi:hypothetical protein